MLYSSFCAWIALFILCYVTPSVWGVRCYHCNSLYDPRCGDPFDPYTIAAKNCSQEKLINDDLKKYESKLCRKIIQSVDGNVRYIRDCAFVGDVGPENGTVCPRKTGTHGVQMRYCTCQGSLCNSAPRPFQPCLHLIAITCITTLRRLTQVI